MISTLSRIAKQNKSLSIRMVKKGYGNVPEFQELGDGIRSGELEGVNSEAIDGCVVCSSVLGPNTHLPEWYNLWVKYHDSYDEEVKPPGTMRVFAFECPNGYGTKCGKYCCTDISDTKNSKSTTISL